MKVTAIAFVGILLLTGNARAQSVNEQAQIIRDFEMSVSDYAHRERCIGHVSPLSAFPKPRIFTLPVAMVFRQVIAEALTEGAPGARMIAPVDTLPLDRPVVFEPFPTTELYDFPELLSNALPLLPRPLEYRLIGSDLVLRDAEADVIVAVLRDAIGHVATRR